MLAQYAIRPGNRLPQHDYSIPACTCNCHAAPLHPCRSRTGPSSFAQDKTAIVTILTLTVLLHLPERGPPRGALRLARKMHRPSRIGPRTVRGDRLAGLCIAAPNHILFRKRPCRSIQEENFMRYRNISFTAAAILALSMTLAGCQKNEDSADKGGSAQKAGEQVDRATAKAGEGLNKAGEKIGQALQKAGEKGGEALQKGGEKLEGAAKDAQAKDGQKKE
jgi:hypothetical protein